MNWTNICLRVCCIDQCLTAEWIKIVCWQKARPVAMSLYFDALQMWKRDKSCTLKSDRATIVAVEKQKYWVLWACTCSLRYSSRNEHLPYFYEPDRLYNTFPHYLKNGTVFGLRYWTHLGAGWGWVVNGTPRPQRNPAPKFQGVGWVPGLVWTGDINLVCIRIRSSDGPARRTAIPTTLSLYTHVMK
jgi:hypothetical protein